jgi:peptide/nickel transport system permease protein
MMRSVLALVPGLGHWIHGRRGRAVALGGTWLAFLVVLAIRSERVAMAFRGRGLDGKLAALFLLGAIVALPLLSWLDYRRLRARPPGHESEHGIGQWKMVYRRFMRNGVARAGLTLVLALYSVAILAPILAPHDPDPPREIVQMRYLGPGTPGHPLGTDKYGRDVLSRIIYGSRISLSIGFVAVGLAITLGTLLGALAGYFGGRVEWIVMRSVDVLIAFPRLFIVLTLIAIYGSQIWLIIAVLGATGWMGVARLVRGEILSLKEREFVQATRALGLPAARVILRHVLPNAMSPVIVAATLMIGDVILTEAVLSFLGLGVQPPTASWGSLINQGRGDLAGAWWIATFPGFAIVLTVVSYNLLGDGLRDALDPQTTVA